VNSARTVAGFAVTAFGLAGVPATLQFLRIQYDAQVATAIGLCCAAFGVSLMGRNSKLVVGGLDTVERIKKVIPFGRP
jgi:hypothetical protein